VERRSDLQRFRRLPKVSEPKDRAQWISDVRTTLEKARHRLDDVGLQRRLFRR